MKLLAPCVIHFYSPPPPPGCLACVTVCFVICKCPLAWMCRFVWAMCFLLVAPKCFRSLLLGILLLFAPLPQAPLQFPIKNKTIISQHWHGANLPTIRPASHHSGFQSVAAFLLWLRFRLLSLGWFMLPSWPPGPNVIFWKKQTFPFRGVCWYSALGREI